jgi:hypothetical protein
MEWQCTVQLAGPRAELLTVRFQQLSKNLSVFDGMKASSNRRWADRTGKPTQRSGRSCLKQCGLKGRD